MKPSFSIRAAHEADHPFIDAFTYAEGMDRIPSLDEVFVAVDAEDDPIGFIRISHGASGAAYVNPVVTNELWRGRGIGRALMRFALRKYKALKLVSRGSSVGFYRALGFEECAWEDIEENVSEDCAHCSWRDECKPLPMRGHASTLV